MKANSYNHNPRRGKVYRVINIFITMAFLFNMSATQGLLMLSPSTANAADSGFLQPSDTGGNGNQWTNPTNAYVSDNTYTTANNESYLQSYEDFNFSVPSNVIIDGIEVQVEAKNSDPSGCRLETRVYSASAGQASLLVNQNINGSDTVYTLGGSNNLWGLTWTGSDFSNDNFYFVFNYDDNSNGNTCNGTASVDQIQAKVYYTVNEPFCGDGIVNGDEQCDSNTQSCTTDTGYAGIQECNMPVSALTSPVGGDTLPNLCTWVDGCIAQESCGDGTINGPEECDDGNVDDDDGCSANCVVEEQSCTDLFVDSFESGNFTNWTSSDDDWSVTSGSGHTGSKKAQVCDKGSNPDILLKTNSTVGYNSIALGYYYRTNHALESSDHVYVEWYDGSDWHQLADHTNFNAGGWTQATYSLPQEAEDNANFKFRFRAVGVDACNNDNFQLDSVSLTSCDTATCGDGEVNQDSEQCDAGDNNGLVCSPAYEGECSYCSDSCEPVTLQGGTCGDGVEEGTEECDDGNLEDGDGCTAQCTIELEPATIYASKVICDSEEDLPNWGGGSGPDITFASVNNWVDQHSDHCQLVQDWQFQWGYDEDVSNLNPGDNTGEEIASGKWNTFSVADPIVLNDLGQNNKIWLREVWDSHYIPFSSSVTLPFDIVSAEFYCNDDHLFYDNFEWISNLELGHEYRCVAFNVQSPQYGTISGTKTDTDINYLNDWEICLTPELNKDATALTVPQEVCVDTGSGEWADGYYEFTNVMPGAYKVQETMQNGWVATQPVEEFYSLTVEAGAEYDLDFINEYAGYCGDGIVNGDEICDGEVGTPEHYTCVMDGDLQCQQLTEDLHYTVHGYKYEDLNGNGAWNPGEMPLDNWEICSTFEAMERATAAVTKDILITPVVDIEPITDCVLTGAGEWNPGYYEFKYYMPGHASLAETMQEGYTKTQPTESTHEVELFGENLELGPYYFGNQPEFAVSIEKDADVDTVGLDEEFSYSVTWEVLGLVTADEVVITDTLPADVSFVSATDGGVYDVGTHTVTWTLTDVAPGTSGVYGITVKTASGVTDDEELINNVEILATKYLNQTAGTNVSSSSVAPTPVVSQIARSASANAIVTVSIPKLLPTLSLDKKVSSGAAESNEQLTYTIDWSVAGNADAHQVVITDPIPTDTGIVSVYSGGVYDGALNTATWDLGTKSPGDSGSVTMVVNTNLALTAGTVIKNTANIDSAENDPVEASATTLIMTSDSPLLQITKDASATTLTSGDTLTYTVVVTNVGAVTATNTMLDDLLPAGLVFADGSGDFNSFKLGDIGIGESATTTYDVNVEDTAPTGSYDNLATTYADNYGKVTAVATVEVESPIVLGDTTEAELAIVKTADVEYTNPGGLVEYTVTVTNNGTEDAQNVILTDHMPDGFVFEGTTEQVNVWEFSTIAVGTTETVTYKASVNADTAVGIYDNVAVANADNSDENGATASVEVRNVAVLGDLTETGTTFRDYILYFLGIVLVASGIWFFTREKKLARSK